MKKVNIYPLGERGSKIAMPKDARLIGVGLAEGVPAIFTHEDPASILVERDIKCCGVGQPMYDGLPCIGVITRMIGPESTFIMAVFDGGENSTLPDTTSARPIIDLKSRS